MCLCMCVCASAHVCVCVWMHVCVSVAYIQSLPWTILETIHKRGHIGSRNRKQGCAQQPIDLRSSLTHSRRWNKFTCESRLQTQHFHPEYLLRVNDVSRVSARRRKHILPIQTESRADNARLGLAEPRLCHWRPLGSHQHLQTTCGACPVHQAHAVCWTKFTEKSKLVLLPALK